jgi:hypothetical protein
LPKVLIVSPRFPPINAADHQRVRMSLPYFRDFGWDPTILCVTPETSDGVHDEWIERSVPADTRVVKVAAWSEAKCRRFGFGHLDYRCLIPLYKAGSKLLKKEKFDLVFFSTTVFTTFLFAPIWKKRFGCRVIFDYQDPWYAGATNLYDRSNAPGGWRKYRLSMALARIFEPFAMRAADFVISVSPGYVKELSKAYLSNQDHKFAVVPFGGAEADFDLLTQLPISKSLQRTNSERNIVYVGRGGPDMVPILKVFFDTLADLHSQDPGRWSQLHFHFIGTNYSPKERTFKLIEPIAEQCNVGDLVSEQPERVPYFEALKLLRDSNAVLLIGSTAQEYTASKMFPCLLSGRPLLAIAHKKSMIAKLLPQFPDVQMATFASEPNEARFKAEVQRGLEWLDQVSANSTVLRRDLKSFSARESTRTICEIFAQVTGAERASSSKAA